jgi:hypothetical protein
MSSTCHLSRTNINISEGFVMLFLFLSLRFILSISKLSKRNYRINWKHMDKTSLDFATSLLNFVKLNRKPVLAIFLDINTLHCCMYFFDVCIRANFHGRFRRPFKRDRKGNIQVFIFFFLGF